MVIKRRWKVMHYSCRQESKSSHPRNRNSVVMFSPSNSVIVDNGHLFPGAESTWPGPHQNSLHMLSASLGFWAAVRFRARIKWNDHRRNCNLEKSFMGSFLSLPRFVTGILWQLRPATTSSAYSTRPSEAWPVKSWLSPWQLICGWWPEKERERGRETDEPSPCFFWMNYNLHCKSEACFRRGPVFITCAVQNRRVTNMLPR